MILKAKIELIMQNNIIYRFLNHCLPGQLLLKSENQSFSVLCVC